MADKEIGTIEQFFIAIGEFFENIGNFLSSIWEGVSYVSEYIASAAETFSNIIGDYLPNGMFVAFSTLLTTLIVLAVIRWIS